MIPSSCSSSPVNFHSLLTEQPSTDPPLHQAFSCTFSSPPVSQSLQLHCFVVSCLSLSPQVLIASALQQTPLLYTQPPFLTLVITFTNFTLIVIAS
ncbi:hypothetical protein Hanom_Chr06g00486421 [Helianthus anomalus]